MRLKKGQLSALTVIAFSLAVMVKMGVTSNMVIVLILALAALIYISVA